MPYYNHIPFAHLRGDMNKAKSKTENLKRLRAGDVAHDALGHIMADILAPVLKKRVSAEMATLRGILGDSSIPDEDDEDADLRRRPGRPLPPRVVTVRASSIRVATNRAISLPEDTPNTFMVRAVGTPIASRAPLKLAVEHGVCVITEAPWEFSLASTATARPAKGVYPFADGTITVNPPATNININGFDVSAKCYGSTVADISIGSRICNGVKDGHIFVKWRKRDLGVLPTPVVSDAAHAWIITLADEGKDEGKDEVKDEGKDEVKDE